MAITTTKSGAETNGSAVQSGVSGFPGQAGKKALDAAGNVSLNVDPKGKFLNSPSDSGKFDALQAAARKVAKHRKDDDSENGKAAAEDANDQSGVMATESDYSDGPMILALADTQTAGAAPTAGPAASAAESATSAAEASGGSATTGTAAAAGVSAGTIFGAAAVVGIAAAGGGGGGGGGSSLSTATGFSLSGTIALGKINNATGLVIEAFKADGTKLAGGTGTVNPDGTYSITVTENYSGPVLVRLKDTDTGTNYVDEGTGAPKDLTTDLRAVVNVSGNGTITVAITPLTELATRELLGDNGGDAGTASTTLGTSVTTANVTTANDNVKTAFGLTGDITTTVPVTVDQGPTAFNAGTAAQQAYGHVLAAISGAEASQGSTGEVLVTLSQNLVGNTLSTSAVDVLAAGAVLVEGVIGNATGTITALDTAIGSTIGGIHLSADTGNSADFITQTAAQTITATLDTALSGSNKLWGSVDSGTTWVDIPTSSVSGTSLNWTGVTLGSGDKLIKFAVTAGTVTSFTGATADIIGKVSTQSYALDSTNPAFSNSAATASFAENGTATAYTAAATDAHAVAYTLSGDDAARFNIDARSGAVTFTAVPNFESPTDFNGDNTYAVTVTATDGAGNAATQSVAITVTNVNEAPTVTSGATASGVAENTLTSTAAYTATATDPDTGTTLTYTLTGTDAALFNIDGSTGAVTFKTVPNFESPADSGGNNVYDVTVTATDNGGTGTLANSKAVTIPVTNLNEAPTVTSGTSASVAENTLTSTAVYTATATDPDAGTTLTYSLTGTDSALFSIDGSTGAVTFNASPNFEAPADAGGNNVYDITVTATDNGTGALSDTETVAITVTNVPEAPTSTTVTATTAVTSQAYSFDVSGSFSDPDANTTLIYSATGLPAGLSISNAGVISGTATTEALTNSITVTATDGSLTTQQTFNLAVVRAPTITAITANVAQANSGDALTFTATLSEPVTITTGATAPTLTFDVSGQTMTATYSGSNSLGTSTLTFTATAPATVDDSSVTVNAISLGDATITGNTSLQAFVTSATGQMVSSFVIDNNVPVFTSGTSASFVENATGPVYTATTTDATAVTYALSGTDAGSFTLTNGALTFNSTPNFEAKSSYSVTITATDALSQAANQGVTVNVTNVNEAPMVVSGAPTTDTIVVGQALTDAEVVSMFVDVDGGDTLIYTQTGLPTELTLNPTTGVVTGTPATTGTANVTFTATDADGLSISHTVAVSAVTAPTITTSIDGVTNFDVTSNIVLTASESVTAVAGKNITIVNDGGTGFHSEATVNTQIIAANDTSKVTISGNTITINPGFDLDLANNYHIEVDAGAFLGSSGVGSVAVSDSTAMNFSTVTPSDGLLGVSSAAASQAMNASGNLVASYSWMDIESVGAPSAANGTARDLSGGNIALVFKDYDTTTTAGGAQDGIGAPDFYVAANGFGAGDLLYVDNQMNSKPNDLSIATFLGDTPNNGTTLISFGTGTAGLGGLVEVSPTGTPTPSFVTVLELQTLLSTTYLPIISG